MKKFLLISTMILSMSSMAMNSSTSTTSGTGTGTGTSGASSVHGASTIEPGGIDGSSPGTRLNGSRKTRRNSDGTSSSSRTRSSRSSRSSSDSSISTQPSLNNQLDNSTQRNGSPSRNRRGVTPGSGMQGDPMDPTQSPNSSTLPRSVPSTR